MVLSHFSRPHKMMAGGETHGKAEGKASPRMADVRAPRICCIAQRAKFDYLSNVPRILDSGR
jgi:hypothetical protein